MDTTYLMYEAIIKPSRSPPGYIFGIVWPILYILIALSYGYIAYQVIKKQTKRKILIPFVINLITNGLFTYLRFKTNNMMLGLIDILLVWITIIRTIWISWKSYKWVSYAQIPYFLWISFATILATSIYLLN